MFFSHDRFRRGSLKLSAVFLALDLAVRIDHPRQAVDVAQPTPEVVYWCTGSSKTCENDLIMYTANALYASADSAPFEFHTKLVMAVGKGCHVLLLSILYNRNLLMACLIRHLIERLSERKAFTPLYCLHERW